MAVTTSGSEYNIGGPTRRCSGTDRVLDVGEGYVATLVEPEAGAGLERRDFCETWWGQGQRPAGLFAYWRSRVPEPNARPQPLIDMGSLPEVFEALAEAQEPRRVAFRYLVALMLLRKRLLEQVGTGESGELLVRRRGEEGVVGVSSPELDGPMLAALSQQLHELLAHQSD